MLIEVCKPTSSRASTLEKFQVVFLPKFCFSPTGSLGVFFPGPLACLPCWLEAQLLTQVHNCSQINHGPGFRWTAAGLHHCLAWLPTQSHSGQRSSSWVDSQSQAPSLDSTGKEYFTTNLSFQGPSESLAEPIWVSWKFKLMSCPRPVTSRGPGRGWTSDTSQQVQCHASVDFRGYIPCIHHWYHHGMQAGSVVV